MIYFKRDEFECKCGCGFDVVDYELARILDDVRAYFNKPITITSGCRCAEHNKNEGGSAKSRHMLGKAADFIVKDIPADTVSMYLESKYPDTYGIGKYNGRTHVDCDEKRRRWDNR